MALLKLAVFAVWMGISSFALARADVTDPTFSCSGVRRRVFTVLSPHTTNWAASGSENPALYAECAVYNVSNRNQNVRLSSQRRFGAGFNVKVSPGANPVLNNDQVNLAPGDSFTACWNTAPSSPNAPDVPRAISFGVCEDAGAIIAHCSVWYNSGSAGTFSAVPVNGGRAF